MIQSGYRPPSYTNQNRLETYKRLNHHQTSYTFYIEYINMTFVYLVFKADCLQLRCIIPKGYTYSFLEGLLSFASLILLLTSRSDLNPFLEENFLSNVSRCPAGTSQSLLEASLRAKANLPILTKTNQDLTSSRRYWLALRAVGLRPPNLFCDFLCWSCFLDRRA